MFEVIGAFFLIVLGGIIGSVRVVEQGDQAIVQRLGKFKRILNPGLNVVVPLLDTVLVESVREQLLDIEPQRTFTKDSVSLEVDAIVFWQILDLRRAYYAVEDLEESLKQIVIATLRNEIGQLTLDEAFSSAGAINQTLLRQLDKSTADWGVKVIRVEVQEFQVAQSLRESLNRKKEAEITKSAEIIRTEGTVKSIQELSQALQGQLNTDEVLRYLVAKDYVTASMELGKSDNSKIIFMDPRALNEALTDLMGTPGVSESVDRRAINPEGEP